MSIGRRLLSLREAKGWSQQQVADHIGVSRATYSQYEIDKREPNFVVASRLAEIYEVTLDFLVHGAEPEYGYQVAKREFSNLIEDYMGPSLFLQFQALSPLGRMWVIDELDTFIQLEHRRESERHVKGGNQSEGTCTEER